MKKVEIEDADEARPELGLDGKEKVMKKSSLAALVLLLATLCFYVGCQSSSTSNANEYSSTQPASANPVASPSPTVDPSVQRAANNYQGLKDRVLEYSQLPGATRLTGQPYIRGKLVALAKEGDADYSLARDILGTPDELVAGAPEEVGTVVLLNYKQQKYGSYTTDGTNTIPAYISLCEVTIIDRSIPAVIYRKTFKGEKPSESVKIYSPRTEIVGQPPNYLVYKFIVDLPRR